ncbi:redox-regulated ATPase YchF [Candidatus Azambacteria bacterium RIFCSPHIGHO2_01_FULL_40_24]|uniref:Ribosome-binding ATPase YchF n=1 Tax=Candidatus Azambacteria bacterium RIFCSPHIGHO2_01_FULL_40_24 TaxID=1797301 RepID=A0A1F5B4U4_9BACT|nr:MAG: redox-regulated ATPase YchF [Candidatus Azambacteria bacterium RIFCSPHIGHO2_01_FULL_40_24]
MSLKIGIVGLPNVGKSTLFKALTREQVNIANFPFATIDPNVGIVKVPDERIQKLAEMSKSKKIIPVAIEFVDIAGLVKGAHEGAGLGNQFLARIREVDVIVEVVRAFEDSNIIHVEGNVSPQRDMETIQLELAMADLQTVNKHLLKNEKDLKIGVKKAQEEKMVLEKIKNILEACDLASKANLSDSELEIIKDLHLLTLKPFIFVFNVSAQEALRTQVRITKIKGGLELDLKFEVEISEMEELEANEFKSESRLDDLIKTAYELLGLITYFTTGEDETRGWTIKAGYTAPQAGAAIHTDFEEKFIKAEVINWQKLLECGSWAKAREKGILRVEGKEYVAQDGDVIEFKI